MVCCTALILTADKTNASHRLSADIGYQLQNVSCHSHTLLRVDSMLLQMCCCFQVQNCPASLQVSAIANQPYFTSFHLSCLFCLVLFSFTWFYSTVFCFLSLFFIEISCHFYARHKGSCEALNEAMMCKRTRNTFGSTHAM